MFAGRILLLLTTVPLLRSHMRSSTVTLEKPPPPRASKEAVRGHVSKVPDPGLPTAHPGIPCHSGRYIIEREIEFSIMSASTEERKYFNA